MFSKTVSALLILICFVCAPSDSASVNLTLQTQPAVEVEIIGHDRLTSHVLFSGYIQSKSIHEINMHYQGLALLVLQNRWTYPLIVGDTSFSLNITHPAKPPTLINSSENVFFYKLLQGIDTGSKTYPFARLMYQAKLLLESSYTIRNIEDLLAKKEEFHGFVQSHYESLKNSDLLKRLIAQYFMMHEYVNYRSEVMAVVDIQQRQHSEIIKGVGRWVAVLRRHIPEHEILNYCIALYYKRSMVTMAALISENYKSIAYCPGQKRTTFEFPKDTLITRGNGQAPFRLETINSEKTIAFVSENCPVSMVATVTKVRQAIEQGDNEAIIVAPLERLSENHLKMNTLIANGSMLFINDEKWRNAHLADTIALPFFQNLD